MPATASVSLTGDPYIDGVLSGTRWGVSSLTYSFPTSAAYYEYSGEPGTNFEAFTAVQQDAVRKVLANYSAIANITFTEVAETSSQHATLRYAESDLLSPGSAWAYFPSTWPQGGDMWFNNSSNAFDNPIKGDYAYFAMLHETGHAIGLKHTHEVMGSFGADATRPRFIRILSDELSLYVGGRLHKRLSSDADDVRYRGGADDVWGELHHQ